MSSHHVMFMKFTVYSKECLPKSKCHNHYLQSKPLQVPFPLQMTGETPRGVQAEEVCPDCIQNLIPLQ